MAAPTGSITAGTAVSTMKETIVMLLFAFSLIMAALAVGGMTMTYHHSVILERLRSHMKETRSPQVSASPLQPQFAAEPRDLLAELIRVMEKKIASVQSDIALIHKEHDKQHQIMENYHKLLEEFESDQKSSHMELINLGNLISAVVRRSQSLNMTKIELLEHQQLFEEALEKAKKELSMFTELDITHEVSQARGSMKLETSEEKVKEHIEYGFMLAVFHVCASCMFILGGCLILIALGYCVGFTYDVAIVSSCFVVYVSACHIWALYSTIGGVEMGLGSGMSIVVCSIVLRGLRRLIPWFSKRYTP